jgi:predicted TPR repeat methyltransferase
LQQAMQLAVQDHQAGRVRKAEAQYQAILTVQADHADAMHLLGLANHQLGRHEHAHALISKAIVLNSNAAEYYNNLGEVCRALNRHEEARGCYAKALSLRPEFPEAHRNLGLVDLAEGKPEQAISRLRETVKRFPDYMGAHLALGDALLSQHRPEEAISIYDHGLEKAPANPSLLCSKGIALRVMGRLDEAVEHYKQAIALMPTVPELYNNLAIIHQKRGQYTEGAACLEKVLELRPDDESARHHLAAMRNITTDRAPASSVRKLFDQYADTFDQHLVGKLEYRAPKVLAELVIGSLGEGRHALDILDLGCGTGLFGDAVKAISKRLVGIDLAPRMIAKARERGIYDELIVGDLLDYMAKAQSAQFGLIAAVDVFIYLGNLLPVFEQAERMLVRGGGLAFSIEAASPDTKDFVLDKTGRYQQNPEYVRRVLVQSGFVECAFTPTCLRIEKNRPVEGFLCLFRKL